jgi:hypothetical protein
MKLIICPTSGESRTAVGCLSERILSYSFIMVFIDPIALAKVVGPPPIPPIIPIPPPMPPPIPPPLAGALPLVGALPFAGATPLPAIVPFAGYAFFI